MYQPNKPTNQMYPSVVEIVIVRPVGGVRPRLHPTFHQSQGKQIVMPNDGPVIRSKTYQPGHQQSYLPPLASQSINTQAISQATLPLIVIRGSDGRVIPTDTIWQRLLALARMRVNTGMPMINAEDWRLPHVHAPAKPDYSRFMPFSLRRYYTSSGLTTRTGAHPGWPSYISPMTPGMTNMQRVHQQQLQQHQMMQQRRQMEQHFFQQHLLQQQQQQQQQQHQQQQQQAFDVSQSVPSLSMGQSYWPPETSFHISTPSRSYATNPKTYYQSDFYDNNRRIDTGVPALVRGKESSAPEFSYGTRGYWPRLCYGCRRQNTPHVHFSKTIRTGGGFTYVKRDIPRLTNASNNPLHWYVVAPPSRQTGELARQKQRKSAMPMTSTKKFPPKLRRQKTQPTSVTVGESVKFPPVAELVEVTESEVEDLESSDDEQADEEIAEIIAHGTEGELLLSGQSPGYMAEHLGIDLTHSNQLSDSVNVTMPPSPFLAWADGTEKPAGEQELPAETAPEPQTIVLVVQHTLETEAEEVEHMSRAASQMSRRASRMEQEIDESGTENLPALLAPIEKIPTPPSEQPVAEEIPNEIIEPKPLAEVPKTSPSPPVTPVKRPKHSRSSAEVERLLNDGYRIPKHTREGSHFMPLKTPPADDTTVLTPVLTEQEQPVVSPVAEVLNVEVETVRPSATEISIKKMRTQSAVVSPTLRTRENIVKRSTPTPTSTPVATDLETPFDRATSSSELNLSHSLPLNKSSKRRSDATDSQMSGSNGKLQNTPISSRSNSPSLLTRHSTRISLPSEPDDFEIRPSEPDEFEREIRLENDTTEVPTPLPLNAPSPMLSQVPTLPKLESPQIPPSPSKPVHTQPNSPPLKPSRSPVMKRAVTLARIAATLNKMSSATKLKNKTEPLRTISPPSLPSPTPQPPPTSSPEIPEVPMELPTQPVLPPIPPAEEMSPPILEPSVSDTITFAQPISEIPSASDSRGPSVFAADETPSVITETPVITNMTSPVPLPSAVEPESVTSLLKEDDKEMEIEVAMAASTTEPKSDFLPSITPASRIDVTRQPSIPRSAMSSESTKQARQVNPPRVRIAEPPKSTTPMSPKPTLSTPSQPSSPASTKKTPPSSSQQSKRTSKTASPAEPAKGDVNSPLPARRPQEEEFVPFVERTVEYKPLQHFEAPEVEHHPTSPLRSAGKVVPRPRPAISSDDLKTPPELEQAPPPPPPQQIVKEVAEKLKPEKEPPKPKPVKEKPQPKAKEPPTPKAPKPEVEKPKPEPAEKPSTKGKGKGKRKVTVVPAPTEPIFHITEPSGIVTPPPPADEIGRQSTMSHATPTPAPLPALPKTPTMPPATPDQPRQPSRAGTEINEESGSQADPEFIYVQDEDELDDEFGEGPTAVSGIQEVDAEGKPKLQRAQVQRRSKKQFGLERMRKVRIDAKGQPLTSTAELDEDDGPGGDALDLLAKFCIIHLNRVPVYEGVFRATIARQRYRYESVAGIDPHGDDVPTAAALGFPAYLAAHVQMDLVHNPVGGCRDYSWESIGDHQLDRVDFEITELMKRQNEVQTELKNLRDVYTEKVANIARVEFAVDPYSLQKTTKGKKGKGKKAPAKGSKSGDERAKSSLNMESAAESASAKGTQTEAASNVHHVGADPTGPIDVNAQLVSMLPPKIMAAIAEKPDVAALDARIEVAKERSRMIEQRLQAILPQRSVLFDVCRDLYHAAQTAQAKPPSFMRRQSARFRVLHPTPDREMNIEDLPEALRQINGNITQQEYDFISMILQLPRRQRINLKLFSAICALSEKVSQLEPILRGLLSKIDVDALHWKIERAKLLFAMIAEQAPGAHPGTIPTEMLYVELRAGGLSEEHAVYCMQKFDRENQGYISFLDFLIFLPLFVAVHQNQISNPLYEAPDLLAPAPPIAAR